MALRRKLLDLLDHTGVREESLKAQISDNHLVEIISGIDLITSDWRLLAYPVHLNEAIIRGIDQENATDQLRKVRG